MNRCKSYIQSLLFLSVVAFATPEAGAGFVPWTVIKTVDAHSAPWDPTLAGNSSLKFGDPAVTQYVTTIVSAADGFSFAPGFGLSMTITDISGATSNSLMFPPNPASVDGAGYIGSIYKDDQPGPAGFLLPSDHMNFTTGFFDIYLNALVGAFTDQNGNVVGKPFAVSGGQGIVNLFAIPDGATQLQLGFNTDVFANNSGSLSVQICGQADPSPAPEPGSLTLFGFGLAGLLGYRWRVRKNTACCGRSIATIT